MKKIEWKNGNRKVEDLIPAFYNPRKLSDKQRMDLEASINEFGKVEPIVINTDNTVIGGHQRLKIYKDMEVKEVDVVFPNRKLNKDEEKKLNLRLNKNGGEFDWSLLVEFDQELLKEVGFDEDEIRVNFGLNDAGDVDIDDTRMEILEIAPPEYPKLKERVVIHFVDIDDYKKIKDAVNSGKIGASDILNLI